MDRAEKLGQGSIPSLLLRFSTPAIVGMLAQALYNVVDRVFVGQAVGPSGHRRHDGRVSPSCWC